MKVDGGKAQTSRGQVDWYGSKYMLRKFEPEFTASLNYRMGREAVKPKPHYGDTEGMSNWVDSLMVSKWAIKSDEAHLKQMSMYQKHILTEQEERHEMQKGSLMNPIHA
jgi:hypothetical protein